MASKPKASVVLCWHMHQPAYQDQTTGEFLMPWVYLHTMKDYSDMAAHLEGHPEARAVVNFSPILLEQISDYVLQLEDWRNGLGPIQDPLLNALVATETASPGSEAFDHLLRLCLRINRSRIVSRFPRFRRLTELADYACDNPQTQRYLNAQFLVDLIVWYHIGWLGEKTRKASPLVAYLMQRGENFNLEDRWALADLIADLLASIGPRYRQLALSGRVELAVSAYSHPMLPLLLDLNSAREATADVNLPGEPAYPGGSGRVVWQLRRAREVFEAFFRLSPSGCWPPEGGLSQGVLSMLNQEGFQWTASGESMLRNSWSRADKGEADPPRMAYQFGSEPLSVFFRDDGLSDLIGFTYSSWQPSDAVGDLIRRIDEIGESRSGQQPCIIPIIMDGENAWEWYPDNAFGFLDELYTQLGKHPRLQLKTFSEVLHDAELQPYRLPEIVAGSWVYGTLTTWLGHPDKNLAWELLCEAKRHYDKAMVSGNLSSTQVERAARQLALCEGSDWFWWLGEDNNADLVGDFEALFRRQLTNLYEVIGHPVPTPLLRPFSHGGEGASTYTVMRPSHS